MDVRSPVHTWISPCRDQLKWAELNQCIDSGAYSEGVMSHVEIAMDHVRRFQSLSVRLSMVVPLLTGVLYSKTSSRVPIII